MPSASLLHWVNDRVSRLMEIEAQCAASQALIPLSVRVRDKNGPGSDVDLLDWLRQRRRAGLYEQGRAIYENGGLNLANLTDEQRIEAEDD